MDDQPEQHNPGFRPGLTTPPAYALVPPDADATTTPGASPPSMSMAVLALIIVASLSAVVGAIYLLIYFKSIKPMSARSRSYADASGGKGDEEGSRKSAGHPFFRRK